MTKTNISLLSIFLVITIFIVVKVINDKDQTKQVESEINSAPSIQNTFQVQENEGENVTVTVEPQALKIGQSPKFKLEFSTHSVDLSFNIAKQSYLLDDKGNRLGGSIWTGSPPGGHHRNGTLTFNTPLTETKYAELVLTNIAEIPERRFRWEVVSL